MISADRRQPKPEADGYAWATEIADKKIAEDMGMNILLENAQAAYDRTYNK